MNINKKPKHKRMTPKECQAAAALRTEELAKAVASIPKYEPMTALEWQGQRDSCQETLVAIEREIGRLETVKALDKAYSLDAVTTLEKLWKL